jgi:hypothetical protein
LIERDIQKSYSKEEYDLEVDSENLKGSRNRTYRRATVGSENLEIDDLQVLEDFQRNPGTDYDAPSAFYSASPSLFLDSPPFLGAPQSLPAAKSTFFETRK